MADAGFTAIFCNVGDNPPEAWATVREEAQHYGVVCGPWLRTTDSSGAFRPEFLDSLIRVADEWGTPFICNSEQEINNTGTECTPLINEMCQGHDWALSTEPWPYAGTEWSCIEAPVLPQLFGIEWAADEDVTLEQWFTRGVKCVIPTYGAYNGGQPEWYERLSPYGVYTADDCANDYASWAPLGVYTADRCGGGPIPDPGGGLIGSQDGITAAMNRLRDMDPKGTKLKKGADGKWPSIDTLEDIPLDQWKAYDKLERTLRILKEAHG